MRQRLAVGRADLFAYRTHKKYIGEVIGGKDSLSFYDAGEAS